MQSHFECLICLIVLSALAGWARAYLFYRNENPPKLICFNFISEIVSSVVAASVSYAFLHHYGAVDGLLFGGSLVGAYVGVDLLERFKGLAKEKLQLPTPPSPPATDYRNETSDTTIGPQQADKKEISGTATCPATLNQAKRVTRR